MLLPPCCGTLLCYYREIARQYSGHEASALMLLTPCGSVAHHDGTEFIGHSLDPLPPYLSCAKSSAHCTACSGNAVAATWLSSVTIGKKTGRVLSNSRLQTDSYSVANNSKR